MARAKRNPSVRSKPAGGTGQAFLRWLILARSGRLYRFDVKSKAGVADAVRELMRNNDVSVATVQDLLLQGEEMLRSFQKDARRGDCAFGCGASMADHVCVDPAECRRLSWEADAMIETEVLLERFLRYLAGLGWTVEEPARFAASEPAVDELMEATIGALMDIEEEFAGRIGSEFVKDFVFGPEHTPAQLTAIRTLMAWQGKIRERGTVGFRAATLH